MVTDGLGMFGSYLLIQTFPYEGLHSDPSNTLQKHWLRTGSLNLRLPPHIGHAGGVLVRRMGLSHYPNKSNKPLENQKSSKPLGQAPAKFSSSSKRRKAFKISSLRDMGGRDIRYRWQTIPLHQSARTFGKPGCNMMKLVKPFLYVL